MDIIVYELAGPAIIIINNNFMTITSFLYLIKLYEVDGGTERAAFSAPAYPENAHTHTSSGDEDVFTHTPLPRLRIVKSHQTRRAITSIPTKASHDYISNIDYINNIDSVV